jgi:uncharacterized protein involved in exopolysaccharide biosynthesis
LNSIARNGSLSSDGDLDLLVLMTVLWRGRWLMLIFTLLLTAAGVAYALLAPKWYQAEVVLIPVQDDPASRLMSQFGGIASLVGVNLAGSNNAEPLAVLKSREFAKSFIEKNDILKVLYAKKWDSRQNSWIGPEDKWPDVRDGVRLFERKIRRILEDRKTGLITISIMWTDPVVATAWSNSMAEEINQRMRDRAIAQAEANVSFLRSEMAAAELVALQQPIGRLMELELQKLMLAKGSTQYSFRVVDAAQVPKRPASPRMALIVTGALVLGAALSALFVVFRQYIRDKGNALVDV